MQRRQFLEQSAAAVGLAALTGCSKDSASDRTADVQRIFGGKEAMANLQKFDNVEAFRLHDSEYKETIDEYKTVAGPVAVDNQAAGELASLLTDEKSYLWDAAKACVPTYGVQIRFTKGKTTLDILFCFACDILLIYWNGKPAEGKSFDPIRPPLVAIMKSLFPNDEVIQKLTDEGCL